MKASELITKLNEIINTEGDKEVLIDDADTGWYLTMLAVTDTKEAILIGGNYQNIEKV